MLMMGGIDNVREYYNQNPQIEWDRLEGRKPEFEITMRYLKEYLKPNSKILDVGGGPGRYAFALTELGHRVTLFDLSEKNIEFAINKSQELGIYLDNYICGNATQLLNYISDKYDAVLCLGPLYHLNDEKDRVAVINNCLEVLKINGIIAFGFISAFAKYTSVLKFLAQHINDESKVEFMREKYFEIVPHLLNYAHNKSLVFERTDGGFIESNYTNPHQLTNYLESFGIETIVLTSSECLLTHHDELRYLPEDIYDSLINVTLYYAKDPALLGSSEHLLYLGRKK